MSSSYLNDAQARRASIGFAAAQTAYALNNGGGIILNQPLVYIDDRTTAGQDGHLQLRLNIPSGFVVRGIYKDRTVGQQNTGADMFMAYNPETKEMLVGIAGTNGVGDDQPDTRSDISYLGANQADWLARLPNFRQDIQSIGINEAGGIENLRFIIGGNSLSGVAAALMPTALVYGLPAKGTNEEIAGMGLEASQFTIVSANPLGCNYAASYLGISDKLNDFSQSSRIMKFAVYNDKTGFDAPRYTQV